MDLGSPTPLLDLFRLGEVPRDLKLLVARGVVAPRGHEQVAMLVLLAGDREPEVAALAQTTIDLLPRDVLQSLLARGSASADVVAYFASRGVVAGAASATAEEGPLLDRGDEQELVRLEAELEAWGGQQEHVPSDEVKDERRAPSALSIVERMKLALKGTRANRSVLIRDPNRLVAAAVLSSPKLTEVEVEGFARMTNVSDQVLRTIAGNRNWTKSYTVVLALTRNPKTPLAVAMPLVGRLTERDLRGLSTDRNVAEGLRIAARKMLETSKHRRH